MKLFKCPRTLHLPFSPGLTDDDKVIEDMSELEGHDAVITLKMDGENCSIYPDGYTPHQMNRLWLS